MTAHFHNALNDLCWAIQMRVAVRDADNRNDMIALRLLAVPAEEAHKRLSGPFLVEYSAWANEEPEIRIRW